MSPTAQTIAQPKPVVNDVAGPAPMPAPNLVENIPVHTPGQVTAPHDEDAELDKIMQDVGRDLHKMGEHQSKHHFWELKTHHKKEANFSTQMTIKNAPQPAAVRPQPPPAPVHHQAVTAPKPAAPQAKAPVPHNKVKPAAQKSQKQPKPPKLPKQHHMPLMVTALTILVTAALIAVAYRAYK